MISTTRRKRSSLPSAASAERPTGPETTMTRLALLTLCLIGLAAPAFAQSSSSESSAQPPASAPDDQTTDQAPAGAPITSAALKMFVDTCTDISSGDPTAYDRANDAGWVPNDTEDTGPYTGIYSGSREIGSFGEVDIWGSVQNFPSQRLGYCRVDFSDTDNLLDFADMAGIKGLSGSIEVRDGGNVYGAWESADKKLLVIGDRTDGAVELEFNLLLGDKPKQ
jgi:hypothetical protein